MYNLIIIDDEYEIRVGLANYYPWDRIGFQVVEIFDSPVSAIDFIKTNGVDVILSDIKMPGMSGLDFARHIHETSPAIRIVFISGYKSFDYLKEAIEYKVFNYLLKPVTHEDINKTFSALKSELDAEINASLESLDNGGGIVASIKTYIDNNIATAGLEDVASHFHMNPNYLSRFFKQKTGSNFSAYLLEQKMSRALHLMKDPAERIYNISEKVGYNSPNNFTRAFKSYFGKTPIEYRNNP